MTTLTAYTESGRTWKKEVKVNSCPYPKVPAEYQIDFGGPIQYYLTGHFLEKLKTHPSKRLCIDMGGRNHGVQESVYVSCEDILNLLREGGFI